jgi:uncharacterized membrane protein
LLILDGLYIGIQYASLKKIYEGIQKTQLNINFIGAFLCYIALVFLLYYFILSKKKKILDAFLLGVAVYAVYETTNYSTFTKWPFHLVIMDTLWGGILFAITTKFYYSIYL